MKITREIYSIGERRYIDIDGERIKIPWRYGRVMCKVNGLRTIQELKEGDEVRAIIELRFWDHENYKVLKEMSTD
jgi:hypothetical protein